MALSVSRSPLVISATSFIRENLHANLYKWEQELLANLALSPYFLLYGIGFALLLPPKSCRGLLMLPIAYATVCAPELLSYAESFESMGMRWYHMIPTDIYFVCYIPITQLGINIALHARSRSVGALMRSLGMLMMFGILSWCIAFIPLGAIQPIVLLVALYFLAYLTREPAGALTNNPMDRSGGSAAS
jgi:hypothetical protein